MTITHDLCVCVQRVFRESVEHELAETKPQDGGVCVHEHTILLSKFVSSSSSVVSQSDSRSGYKHPRSDSTLLSLLEVDYAQS